MIFDEATESDETKVALIKEWIEIWELLMKGI